VASVNEIIDRLAEEDSYYGLYRPGLGVERTERLNVVQPNTERVAVNWLPNRKVVSGFVAGLITLGATKLGLELGPDLTAALVVVVMTGISYLVPLPEAPAEDEQY